MWFKQEWIKRCLTVMIIFFVSIGIGVEFSANTTILASEDVKSETYKITRVSEGGVSQETEYENNIVTKDAGAGDVTITVSETKVTEAEVTEKVTKAEVTEEEVTEANVTENVTEAKVTEKVTEADVTKPKTTEPKTTEPKVEETVNYAAILSELQASATKSVNSAISFLRELDNGTRIYSFEGDEYTVPANLLKRAAMVSASGYVEKITQVPHYVQQSYPDTPYGNYGTIESHGCGITSCAMVYSYLMDYEIRPDELAKTYGRYNTYNGSLYSLFLDSAEDFNLEVKMTYSWNEVVDSLKEGCVVIANVQDDTIFTTGGHYIVYYGITDDGKILINDSNIYNYGDWRSRALPIGFKNGFDQSYCKYSFPCFIYEAKDIEKVSENNKK